MNDLDRDRRLAELVKDAFPQPPDPVSLLPGVQRRVRRNRRLTIGTSAVAAALVVGAVAVPLSLTGGEHSPQTASGPPTASSAPASPFPAWARECFEVQNRMKHSGAKPATRYIGLTRGALDRAIQADKLRLIVIARSGRCITAGGDLVQAQHLYVAFGENDRVAAAWAI